jgi:SRF-type transcription factor (DNA-binding and dimerisation domain)
MSGWGLVPKVMRAGKGSPNEAEIRQHVTLSGSQFWIPFGGPYLDQNPSRIDISGHHFSTPLFIRLCSCRAVMTFNGSHTPFQPIKVVRRRRLDTKRAKRQQQNRRKDNLFKKACEYSLECGAYVYLAIKIKNGRIFTFNSDSTGEWPLPEAQMVRHHFLKGL